MNERQTTMEFTPEERTRLLHDMEREHRYTLEQERVFASLFEERSN